MTERTSAILDLDTNVRDEIIDVLTESFFDYPVFKYILKDAGRDEYERHLRLLNGFYVDARLMRGWPVFGIRVGPRLVAAMLVSDPVFEARPPALDEEFEKVKEVVGADAIARGEEFEKASARLVPEARTYFVGMLGVIPAYQKQGFGQWLMSHIEQVSRERPESDGITLTTEVEANVRFYQKLGYRVLGQSQIADITSWFFYLEH